MAGCRGRAAPPRAACRAAADARAHAFDELCPVHGVRQAQRVEMALRWHLGVGLRAAIGGLPTSPRGLGEWLARRIRRGAALLPGARAHKVVERVAPSRADDAVTAERDIAKRTSLSITTRNAAIRWTERATTSFTYLCFVATAIRRQRSARVNASSSASVIKKRARRVRNNASRASRARKPRRRQ